MAAGFAEALGTGLASAIGTAVGAAFFILLILALAGAATALLVFLVGLQKRPRTTVLSYSLAFVFGVAGDAVDVPSLLFAGALLGAVTGWYWMEDEPVPFFSSRPYRLLLYAASAGGILLSLALLAKMLQLFGPYLVESPAASAIFGGILLMPGVAGVLYIFSQR